MANTKTAAFENAPGALLNRRTTEATSLVTTGTLVQDVEVSHTDWLLVQGDIVGSADGDLGVTVAPFENDNVTLSTLVLTADESAGPTNASGATRFWGRYNVKGIDRVRITWTNNNAATKILTRASWNTRRY